MRAVPRYHNRLIRILIPKDVGELVILHLPKHLRKLMRPAGKGQQA